MSLKIANNAVSRLATSLSASSTNLGVLPGEGAKFPSLADGDWFPLAIIKTDGSLEIVRCTSRSSDTMTVQRAQEGTVALAFEAGDRVELRLTSKVIGDIDAKAEEAVAKATEAMVASGHFEAVPNEFKSWEIVVTQPHLRKMVWSPAQSKYVRAPWHAPGQLSYFLRDVPAGYVEVRSDVVLNKADFPDLAEYLGVTGATFVLDETRGEFLRTLDSGRGIDSGRAVGSWQDSDNKSHTHTGSTASAGAHTHTVSGTAASAGAHTHTAETGTAATARTPDYMPVSVRSGTSTTTTSSSGAHTHTVSGTAASAGAHTHTVTVAASGGAESRPRNRAYRLAVQY